MQNLFLYLLVIAWVSACSTNITPPAAPTLPAWYHEPNLPGYLGISVSAPVQTMGGLEAQRRVAMSKARAELGRITRLQVQSSQVIHESSHNNKTTTDMQTQTRLSSTATLDVSNMEIKAEWLDPSTHQLYIWVVLPEK